MTEDEATRSGGFIFSVQATITLELKTHCFFEIILSFASH